MQSLAEALLDRADHEAAHQAQIAKAHLGFRRVDVDVDLARIAGDEERDHGVAVGRQEVQVGRAERARERLVLTARPLTNTNWMQRVRPAEGRKPDAAGEADAFPRCVEAKRIGGEFVAERLPQPLGLGPFAGA